MVRKLNVGSGVPKGEYLESEWTNIDVYAEGIKPENGAVVYDMNVLDLNYRDNYFDEIRAIHVLEHINRNQITTALKECYRVLKPEGVLYIEVPNFRAVITNLYHAFVQERKHDIHIWTTSVYGKQRYEGDRHCWGFTEHLLREFLEKAGVWHSVERDDNMISNHHQSEPVILMKAVKL